MRRLVALALGITSLVAVGQTEGTSVEAAELSDGVLVAPVELQASDAGSFEPVAELQTVDAGVIETPFEAQTVVTGTRSERRLSEATVATEVIGRKQIEAVGAETLADLLAEQPNVEVTRSLAGPSIRMQGLDPKYVLILVDGERTNGRVDGAVDLDRFLLEDIERIEIVRGPSSSLYGSDAIGGVVNLITRRQRNGPTAEGRFAYGHPGLIDLSALAGYGADAIGVRVNGGFHRSPGFDLDPSDVFTTGPAYDGFNVGARVDLEPGSWQLTGKTAYSFRDARRIEPGAGGSIFDRTNRTETFSGDLSTRKSFGDWDLRASGHYTLFRDQYLSDQRNSDALDTFELTRDHLGQLSVQLDHTFLEQHTASLGVEGIVERLEADRLVGGFGNRYRGAVFVQDDWRIRSAPLVLVVVGARLDGDSQFGLVGSPRIALRVDPLASLALRASAGMGFRAPSFKELLLDFTNAGVGYVIEGNPNLKPEKSISVNASAEWKPKDQVLVSLNLFHNELTDLIDTATIGEGAGTLTRYGYVNIASAFTQGLESVARVRPWRPLTLEAGYAFTHSLDRTLALPLEGRAAHRVTFDVRGRLEAAKLEGGVRAAWTSRRPFYFDFDAEGRPITTWSDSAFSLDARVSFTPVRWVSVFAMAENLLDQGDVIFQPIQPRTFTAGVALKL